MNTTHQLKLKELFSGFLNGIRSKKSETPRKYLAEIGLNAEGLNIGFCSGQFHHRKDEGFKAPYVEMGVLTRSIGVGVNSPDKIPYACFGAYGVVFALKDVQDEITNLYAVRFKLQSNQKVFLNDEGVYPSYPHALTKRLYICENVIETASLIQSKVLENRESVVGLFDGKWMSQHEEILQSLPELEEVIYVAGSTDRTIVDRIKLLVPAKVKLSVAVLPDGEDLNTMWLNYGASGIIKFLEERKVEEVESADFTSSQEDEVNASVEKIGSVVTSTGSDKLTIHSESRMSYVGGVGVIEVLGQLSFDVSQLKVTLHITELGTKKKHRVKIDLYDPANVEYNCKQLTEKAELNANQLEVDLVELTDLLEAYRNKLIEVETNSIVNQDSAKELSPKAEREAVEFLSKPNLLGRIDELLEKSGIVGEEDSRKNLFIIASSYKFSNPLHAVVRGTSGSGKTHLINTIMDCMPTEDIKNITRVSSKTFYHYQKDELVCTLLIIQDWDGIDEDARIGFRELQSAGYIHSHVAQKDRFGNTRTTEKIVNARFASMSATTKEIYFDNESRSIIIGVDESLDQTKRINDYKNKMRAGAVSIEGQESAKQQLRNAIRVLKPYEVVNPYADKIEMPQEAKMLRRLNDQFQNFVSQITILNQYQHKQDARGRLITTTDDVRTAIDVFFSSIVLKVDELDGSTRQFFEQLKTYVKLKSSTHSFSVREIRQELNLHKTTAFEFFQNLQQLEYIAVTEGSANRGFKYQISYWDNLEKLKTKIKEALRTQLEVM